MKIRPLTFILILYGCTPLTHSSVSSGNSTKVLSFSDVTYEQEIKTVILHPPMNGPQASLLPGVTGLAQPDLVLEFDDMTTQRDSYYVKIIHCNFDWTKSTLTDLDFLAEYNEFPINNFEYSADTHIPYIHYWFQLPRVKLPGNYLLIVFRGSDKSDLILSKRFIVYDQQVTFQSEGNLIGAGSVASLNQQMNFTVNYKNVDIVNPLESVKVVIRQNHRWDNLASDLRPSFVREIEKQLEYRFFDEAKMFKGGNEFRFFDMRSLNSPGRNVASVNKAVKPYEVYVQRDKSRADEAYGQYLDLNGGFILDNFDYRDATFSNYAFVNFTLSTKPVSGDVYVTGALHQWNLDDENLLVYDTVRREYTGRLLLKQGWYDYQYLVRSKQVAPYFLEGSHFETENIYEIFVYYRPFKPRADLLIGYLRFERNKR
jgi:hypothetical protein